VAGLTALYAWYVHVRPVFAIDFLSRELIRGLQDTLVQSIRERVRQLEKFCNTLGPSQSHDRILSSLDRVGLQFDQFLAEPQVPASGERLVSCLNEQALRHGCDYVTAIQQLPSELKATGSDWLLNIETSLSDRLTV
jgi:UDP-N-acetylglucosamine/UDP-N-acetylgalactosamine diphosphorylase